MKILLIFEPFSGGHRANFIRWLKAAVPEYSACRFAFFTFENLSGEDAIRLAAAGRWEKQLMLYRLFRAACRKYNPDHVLILELTHLEFPLALFGSPVPVSAILFVQYPELPRGLKFFSKHWKTALLLRRTPVKNLFLLNGEHSCNWLKERFGSFTRFIPVPDPAPDTDPDPEFAMRDSYGIDLSRRIFLFFGAISPRKGADVLINALHLLPPKTAAKSTFLFCGEPEQHYRKTFEKSVARLRAGRPDIKLNIEDRFVSDQRMMALFEQSDVVLMPYIRPEYSSGILALAAKACAPVIGPDSGLLGRLIRQNGLGAVCSVSPEALAKRIAEGVQHLPSVDESKRSEFVKKSCPEQFSQIILNAVCYEC
ncbi:MAG: glycosyltransferase [Kiritimatiellales bacterium]